MNTLKGYRIFFALICLTLMVMNVTGNVEASRTLHEKTDFNAIDDYITTQMKNLGIPGMALGMVQDGQIAHVQGFGVADSSGRAITPQTPFYIGSLTKSFTALAIMQLVEAGKIDLDAPVQNYLPWFELADKEATAKITVRNLLNQTTGISTRDGNNFWDRQEESEEVVRGFDKIQLTRPVGSTFQYSNVNFIIAGLIVEKVSGQSYADYVTQHILEPLDMRHSYASRAPAQADGLAEGHQYIFGHAFRDEKSMPPSSLSAGALIASAEDMSHYMIAQLSGGRYGDASVLSPQGITELHTPAIPFGAGYYAMGWSGGTMDGIAVVNHNGDTGRYHANIILMPGKDTGFVLLANASGFEQRNQVDQIAMGIFYMLNGKPPSPISLPFMSIFLHWFILLTPFLQILGIVLVWRKRQGITGWGVILVVVLNIAAVLLLLGLSQLIPFPLPSLLVFYPNIGYGLITVATLGIGWSIVYTVLTLRARRAK